MASEAQPAHWTQVSERGSVAGIKFFVVVVTFFGRAVGRFFLFFALSYFVLFARGARRASKAYLQRIGLEPTFRNVAKHIFTFGHCTLDRIFFLRGLVDRFETTRTGSHYLAELRREKRGAILLGAHLGSFEAMRAVGGDEHLPLNVVVNNVNARMVSSVLKAIDPENDVRVIDLADGGLDFMFKIRERIEAGEMVALLGDRLGRDGRMIEVPFLGTSARFPVGPFLLAATLKCPIYLTFGLYRGGNRYDLFCEKFADRVDLPRKRRKEALEEYAARFAKRLEHYCREAPFNWFNFYDFWEEM